jgi:D-alanyl-D-alanine carboxypeptidase/D-alanyl-D-alanine-endopeptidase (penicillin-binding protein 4)
MRLKLLFLLSFLGLSNSLTPQISGEKRLHDYVTSIINDNNLKGAFFSIKLLDFETEQTIFEHNSSLKMIPASIQKVITTGIGFVNLGDSYTFKTSVYYAGTVSADSVLDGNLYIVGGGDPSSGSKNFPESEPETVFNKIMYGLKNAGISKINGRIITDDSYFKGTRSTSETVHPSWEWEDIGSAYGTGVHGLNFCGNAFTINLSSKTSAEVAVALEYPYTEFIMPKIIPDIMIIHKDSLPDIAAFSSPETDKYLIRGDMPAGKELAIECALQNPAEIFRFWLTDYLIRHGIVVYNNVYIVDSTFNGNRRPVVEIESAPYHELAKFTNYVSNNLFADVIFRTISKTQTGEASFSKSAANMNNLLQRLNLNTQNVRIVDGSGLSRHNLTTAEFMCEYLRTIKLYVPDFHLFLPSPGTAKSTLRYFMSSYSNKNNKERIFLKSGSMTGTLNYAGYIINKKGETMCVAIMTNNFLCKTKDLRPKIERLIYLISEL